MTATATSTTSTAHDVLKGTVYGINLVQYDGVGNSVFTNFRRSFFEQIGHATISVNEKQTIKGLPGKLKARMSKNSFKWLMTSGEVNWEESLTDRDGYVVIRRNYDNVVLSKTYYNRDHTWIKSEYFKPEYSIKGHTYMILTHSDGCIEKKLYDMKREYYESSILYPIQYMENSAIQSILNARFGEPEILLFSPEGSYSFCSQEELQSRTTALNALKDSNIMAEADWSLEEALAASRIEPEPIQLPEFDSMDSAAELTAVAPAIDSEAQAGRDEEETETLEVIQTEGLDTQSTAAADNATSIEKLLTSEDMELDIKRPESYYTEETQAVLEASKNYKPSSPEEDTGRNKLDSIKLIHALTKGMSNEKASILMAALEYSKLKEELETAADTEYNSETVKTDAESSTSEKISEEDIDTPSADNPDDINEAAQAADEQTAAVKQENSVKHGLAGETLKDKAEIRLAHSEELPLNGHNRITGLGGKTAYEGGYKDGRRSGFGCHYYKDGLLCYAGGWENDQRNGPGVSIRHSDRSMHIANWKNGQPDGLVSLYDSQGRLTFSGSITEGKKQGIGISYSESGDHIFVGKWQNGQPTELVSVYSSDGSLLYTGMWKDGKRHGHGVSFDTEGHIIFSGEWYEDRAGNGISFGSGDTEGQSR